MLSKVSAHIVLPFLVLAMVSTLFASLFIFSGKTSQVVAADDCQTFPETGFKVCGRFLTYWKANGGLAQQGFPISDVFSELNQPPPAGDGKEHRVQYFQRARFEEHLENQPPYDVLLGLLGAEQFKTKNGTQPAQGTPFLVVNGKRTQDKISTQSPEAGYTFLILDLTVTNTFGKPFDVNRIFFKVISTQNFSYSFSSDSYSLPKVLQTTKLAPGEVMRGEIAFEVPANETVNQLRYEDFNDKITITIP